MENEVIIFKKRFYVLMFKKLAALFLVCLTILQSSLGAEDNKIQFTLVFPINHIGISKPQMPDSLLSFLVKVPESFTTLSNISEVPSIYEFVPKEDIERKRVRRLKMFIELGAGTSSRKLVEAIKKSFKDLQGVEILEENNAEYDNYKTSELGVVYPSIEGRDCTYFRAYSGPSDILCIQYTIILQNGESPKEGLERCKKFLDQSTKLLDKTNSIITPEGVVMAKEDGPKCNQSTRAILLP
jgi:hypothetical protein